MVLSTNQDARPLERAGRGPVEDLQDAALHLAKPSAPPTFLARLMFFALETSALVRSAPSRLAPSKSVPARFDLDMRGGPPAHRSAPGRSFTAR